MKYFLLLSLLVQVYAHENCPNLVAPELINKSDVKNHQIPQESPPEFSANSSKILCGSETRNKGCSSNLNVCNIKKRSDYTYVGGVGAYKFHNTPTVFNTARKICNEEGAHLAVIESDAEEAILMGLFQKHGTVIRGASATHVAFIGIHDLYAEGDWVTILGDSINKIGHIKFTNKWGGQPDNNNNNQHCGTLLREGDLDDYECDAKLAFICELYKPPCECQT